MSLAWGAPTRAVLVAALIGVGLAPESAAAAEPGALVLAAPQREDLRQRLAAPGARDAIARVAYAEAAGQGDSGLAAVVFTILNRLASGRWGDSVDAVVNARAQFEPVLRAGGDWRALPPIGAAGRSRIEVMINLALDGRLPDPTGGALYFQNPAIVAARAASGQVSPRLVHFGGAAPSVVIGDHAFYRGVGGGPVTPAPPPVDPIFVPGSPTPAPTQGGARGLFVLSDGQTVETLR